MRLFTTTSTLFAILITVVCSSQSAYGQTIDSNKVIQVTDSVFHGQNQARIIEFELNITNSSTASLPIQFVFSSQGTGKIADVTEARLYYMNGSLADAPLALADTFGRPQKNLSSGFTFFSSKPLATGSHYFVLTYDLDYDITPGDSFDAELVSLTFSGKKQTLATNSPIGKRYVAQFGSDIYCPLAVTYAANYQIGPTHVKFGNLIDRYSNGSNVYELENKVFDIKKGSVYPFLVRCGPTNPEQIAGWIDWNGNGYFEAQEQIMYKSPMSLFQVFEDTVVVPCNITPGYKRMRFVSDYAYSGVVPTPCSTRYQGEAEDYILNVLPELGPIAAFIADTPAYAGSSINLINQSTIRTDSVYYEWDIDNNGSYDSIGENIVVIFPSSGNKTVKMRATGFACDGITRLRDSTSLTIAVKPTLKSPLADFVSDKNFIPTGERITLKDLTQNGVSKWSWTIVPASIQGKASYYFADGTNKNSKNPVLVFNYGGSFSVALDVTNSKGSDRIAKINYIKIGSDESLCSSHISSTDLIKDDLGVLYDDGGPNNVYTSNLTCGVLIQPTCGKEVHLDLDFVDITLYRFTGQPGDYLRIYDGLDNTGTELHTSLGFSSAGIQNRTYSPMNLGRVTATSGSMFVEFATDNGNVSDGFRARWSISPRTLLPQTTVITGPDTAYINSPVVYYSSNKKHEVKTTWEIDGDGLPDALGHQAEHVFTTTGTQKIMVILDACGSLDTFTKNVVVVKSTKKPAAAFHVEYEIISRQDSLFLLDDTRWGATDYTWTVDRSKATKFIAGTSSKSKNPILQFDSIGYYSITLTASNSFGTDQLVKKKYILVRDFCIPTVTATQTSIGINRVALYDMDSTLLLENKTINTGSYTNYSYEKQAVVERGGRYFITLERDAATTKFRRAIWIDYNFDGIFSDKEFVAQEASGTKNSWTVNFNISNTANLGLTRMRVAANETGKTNVGCGPHSLGEFEDYGIIIQKDSKAPVLTLVGNDTILVPQCFGYIDQGVTAIDNADGDISSAVVVTGTVNTKIVGNYTLTYSSTDKEGNKSTITRLVIVSADKAGPLIQLIGNEMDTVEVFNSYTDPGALFADSCSGISSQKTTGTVNTSILGSYALVYSALDKNGNLSEISRTVWVVDNTPPVISFTSKSDTIYLHVHEKYEDTGVVVTDNYYTGLGFSTISQVIDVDRIGTYIVRYYAEDPSGNKAQPIERIVIVRDGMAPVYNQPMDSLSARVFSTLPDLMPTFNDNFNKASELVIHSVGKIANPDTVANYYFGYWAEDQSGNISDTAWTFVEIYDDIAPTITLVGNEYVDACRWKDYVDEGVTTGDNYWKSISLSKSGNYLNSQSSGSYSIVYEATDGSGNKTIATRFIQVYDPGEHEGCDNVSSSENLAVNEFKIFPNPATNLLTIYFSLAESMNCNIVLYNILGEQISTVFNANEKEKSLSLELDNLTEGMYFINLHYAGKTEVRSFIIQR